jgi:large subunit ribosomal protein L24
MKEFSINWNKSVQARKQRKYRYNAPTHIRHKLVSAHLDKALRKELKKRSLPVRKGDEIKVLVGDHRGKSGKVARVDLKRLKVFVEEIKTRKVSGQEVQVALEPSNLVITKLNLDDKKRKKFLTRKEGSGAGKAKVPAAARKKS